MSRDVKFIYCAVYLCSSSLTTTNTFIAVHTDQQRLQTLLSYHATSVRWSDPSSSSVNACEIVTCQQECVHWFTASSGLYGMTDRCDASGNACIVCACENACTRNWRTCIETAALPCMSRRWQWGATCSRMNKLVEETARMHAPRLVPSSDHDYYSLTTLPQYSCCSVSCHRAHPTYIY
jgi:hypothetical protein